MKNIFTDHPHSIGETYFKHALEALFISARMTYTSIAMLIHAVLPFLFVKTARKTVYYFYDRFQKRLTPLVEKTSLEETEALLETPEVE
ncbi:MAG: hypothetical protein S4CHLAM7_05550 [Chlamydiae bacterium]|nr:hypothetical protein [Chlamydiota bacterium]